MAELNATLPKEKQTVLGLYVTAQQAYEKWKAASEKVKILDVRTPEEFLFVGHCPKGHPGALTAKRPTQDADVGRRLSGRPRLQSFLFRIASTPTKRPTAKPIPMAW